VTVDSATVAIADGRIDLRVEVHAAALSQSFSATASARGTPIYEAERGGGGQPAARLRCGPWRCVPYIVNSDRISCDAAIARFVPEAAVSRCSNAAPYSITSSASVRKSSEILTPSAFAVFKLITS
jgi:hypothetical protein